MVQTGLDLRVNYDSNSDVAYFSFGEPKEGLSVETGEGIIVRVDPETDRPIGVTVLDFSKRFLENPGRFISLVPMEGSALNSQEG